MRDLSDVNIDIDEPAPEADPTEAPAWALRMSRDFERVVDKIVLLRIAELERRLNVSSGERGEVSSQVDETLETRIKSVFESSADPGQCQGAKFLSKALGARRDDVDIALQRLEREGYLYSRGYYRGRLYFRTGFGPRAAQVPTPQKAPDAGLLEVLHDAVWKGTYEIQKLVQTARNATGQRFLTFSTVREALEKLEEQKLLVCTHPGKLYLPAQRSGQGVARK